MISSATPAHPDGPPVVRMPRSVRALLLVGALGQLVYTAYLAGAFGGRDVRVIEDWLQVALIGVAVAVVGARAARVRVHRAAWLCFAVAFASWGCGFFVYNAFFKYQHEPPSPSWADVPWLGFYPFVYAGLMLLLRGRVQRFYISLWLDGIIVGLALAALATPLVIEPALRADSGDTLASIVALAHPLADALMLLVVCFALVVLGWQVERVWVFLAGALALNAGFDLLYARQVAEGACGHGGLLDAG
jgi:hypothetical protein